MMDVSGCLLEIRNSYVLFPVLNEVGLQNNSRNEMLCDALNLSETIVLLLRYRLTDEKINHYGLKAHSMNAD